MSKYLVIGDPHFTNKNLDKAKTLFSDIRELTRHSRIQNVIWLGDLFDTKEIIRGKTLNTIYTEMQLDEHNINHIVLVGNHDYFNLECEDHALQVFKELPNVIIVDTPQIIDNMYFIPYTHDVEDFKKKLKYAKGNPVIFIHNEIHGFDYGNGHLADCNIRYEDFTKFNKVIAGHFHKHQESGNIMYLGSPFSQSFGESNQEKYIASYDSESTEVELIKTKFPRHLTFDIDCDYYVTNINKELQLDCFKNDYIRVILTGEQENINLFPKDKYPDIKFNEKPTTKDMESKISDTLDNISQFKTWANIIKKLDKNTIDLGLSILEGVKK